MRRKPSNTVTVSRPGRWGNPYRVDVYGLDLALLLHLNNLYGHREPSAVAHLDDSLRATTYALHVGFLPVGAEPDRNGALRASWPKRRVLVPLDARCQGDLLLTSCKQLSRHPSCNRPMPALLDGPQPAITHADLMLATPGKLRSDRGWLYELKYDGFRCLVSKYRKIVRLESRSGRDMSECFPELVEEIRPIRQDFVIDAELVVLDEQGRPVWERLRARHMIRKPERIREAAATDPAALFAFDLLCLNGADFRVRSLLERKAVLHRLLPANRRIRYAGHFLGSCEELWTLANERELEGIVAKDAASTYTAGRTSRWLKIKTIIGRSEKEREGLRNKPRRSKPAPSPVLRCARGERSVGRLSRAPTHQPTSTVRA